VCRPASARSSRRIEGVEAQALLKARLDNVSGQLGESGGKVVGQAGQAAGGLDELLGADELAVEAGSQSERKNLRDEVEPDVTYRDVEVGWVAGGPPGGAGAGRAGGRRELSGRTLSLRRPKGVAPCRSQSRR
jgi:hypothetical protein